MKYFVVSDTHGFASEMKSSLRQAGFKKACKDHALIVCGDVFDRGTDAIGVYKFLSSIPKKRCILIKGNHEKMFFELLEKDLPDDYDFSNGTVGTFCQIAKIDPERLDKHYYFKHHQSGAKYRDKISSTWQDIKSRVRESDVYAWLKSSQWVNYYELGRFIFVHSFIPLVEDEYDPHWREASAAKWEDASWGCPWRQYQKGYFKPEADKGKTLVCGHWQTDDFFYNLKRNYSRDGDIYYSKDLIAIDGGVWYQYDYVTMKKVMRFDQNVLVIDESMKCSDRFGDELKELPDPIIIETVSVQ